MSLENDSIKTAECAYHGSSELLDEGVHGVLLWDGWLTNTIMKDERLFSVRFSQGINQNQGLAPILAAKFD
jgi:hypothetical protein